MIKGLLFDYGGTIDTNGLHWAIVLKRAYAKQKIIISDELFNNAYSYGERSLAINPLVQPFHNFYDVLLLKVTEQFKYLSNNALHLNPADIELIANDCNQFARDTVQNAKSILQELSNKYPLVMVSNFYGNLNSVLKEFGILGFFEDVVESAIVGVRKPNPKIYQLGIERLALKPDQCMVVGDSFTKDIIPAKEIGCHTMWLRKQGWEDDFEHVVLSSKVISDIEIHDFSEITGKLLA